MRSVQHTAKEADRGREMRRGRFEPVVFAIVLLVVGWFYVWSARPEDRPWNFGARQDDYFNLLVDGMLEGHLSLKAEVPPELLTARDPYDPAARPAGVALHDASLYQGKYYLYFGVTPVVTLLLPFRVLTHTALPLPLAVVIFSYAGFLAAAATFLAVRRRYFASAGTLVSAGVLLALGWASVVPVLVRRANVWELPLSSGYCFGALAVFAAFRALHANRRRTAWIALVSLAMGLAIGARPTYLFALGFFVPLVAWWVRQYVRSTLTGGEFTRALAALALPLAVVGLALAVYNYERFGDPLEFGVKYQLTAIYEGKARHFSPTYARYNLGLYGFLPLEWSRYFPFVHYVTPDKPPAGHWGVEQPFGVLKHLPMLWLALAAPLALTGRNRSERQRLGVWMTAVGVAGVGTLAVLSCFYAAIARYETDFVPPFLLLGGVGVLGIERLLWRAAARARGRQDGRPRATSVASKLATYTLPPAGTMVLAAAALGSAVVGALFSLVIYGNFQRSNLSAYARWARALDTPAYWLERATGATVRPVELVVHFGAATSGREPLLRAGWQGEADHVFVEYREDGAIRLGYARDAGALLFGRWTNLDRAVPHRVSIELGSLFPPEEHPVYRRWSEEQMHGVTRRVRITVDGQEVLNAYQRFPSGAPGHFTLGQEEAAVGFGARFSGRLELAPSALTLSELLARPVSTTESPRPAEIGSVSMRVTLPAIRRVGAREPLVVTGITGAADFLFVEYLGGTKVRFGFEHWGKAPLFSEPLQWSAGDVNEVTVVSGSFPAADKAVRDRIVVSLNGGLVWSQPARFYRAEASDVYLGENPLGGTSCEAKFTGSVAGVRWNQGAPVGSSAR